VSALAVVVLVETAPDEVDDEPDGAEDPAGFPGEESKTYPNPPTRITAATATAATENEMPALFALIRVPWFEAR